MTPIEVNDAHDEQTMNYSGEAKTECLVLCSGLGALHNQKLNQSQSSSPPRATEAYPSVSNSRLAVLRNSERRNQPGRTRKIGIYPKTKLPIDLALPVGENRKPFVASNSPHMVKVSVYTKVVNPYVVIYDSNKKYAKPAACLKLVNCTVKAGNTDSNESNDNEDDNCTFRIFPNKHEDVDSAGIITLRASTSEKRDEWVQFLNDVSNGKVSNSESLSGYVPGSSVLPTLVEQEDNEGESNAPAESLKAPSRRKMREGRRSSLNSLGIRLRCYSIGKER